MTGGKISGNTASNGGGVLSYSFTMVDGEISNNTASDSYGRGGVYVNSGMFTMEGGVVAGIGTSVSNVAYGSPSLNGIGIIIAWNKPAGTTPFVYTEGTNANLTALPNEEATVVWAVEAGKFGISYENGGNKGFIEISEVTVITQDNADIAVAKAMLEGTDFGSVSHSILNSQEMAKEFVEDIIDGLELNGVTSVVANVDFQAAVVGTAGSFTFTVALNKGTETQQITDVLTLVIKADPAYSLPTGLTATYGDVLSSVELPDGWTWMDAATTVGNAGLQMHKAIFTPNDITNYDIVENVDVSINVAKADYDMSEITLPQDLTAVYGNLLSSVDLPDGWSWQGTGTVGNAGERTHKATFTPEDTENYDIVTVDVEITVAKANYDISEITLPQGLTATYGDLLSSVELPTGWSWEGTGTVGNAGTQIHKATFTPEDTDNYNTVTDIEIEITITKADYGMSGIIFADKSVTYNGEEHGIFIAGELPPEVNVQYSGNPRINAETYTITATFKVEDTDNYNVPASRTAILTINKANPNYTVPTGLTATYGDMLSSVALPYRWEWEGTGTVGNAGTRIHKATFTPEDTQNYNVITDINVTVTVKTLAELCVADGNHWIDDQCKTDAQILAETIAACKADGKVWEAGVCRAKTPQEVCTEEGDNWVDDQCKTDAQILAETIAACEMDGKVWEAGVCRNKTEIAKPTLTANEFTYNASPHTVGLNITNPAYTLTGDITKTNAGNYTATITLTNPDSYKWAGSDETSFSLPWKINKANPVYTPVPTGLTATHGDLLSSVELPNGWSWQETGTVGNAGTQIHKAAFTPEDTQNYNAITDIDLTVTVKSPQDDIEIAAAKATVEGTDFGSAAQSMLNTRGMAKGFAEDIIDGLELNGVAAEVVNGTFTAAISGTIGNPTGTDGIYEFTVTLSKGTGTQQTTAKLTLVITATPANLYAVSFNSNGGTAVEGQSIPEGGTIAKPDDPVKEGFTFLGWVKEAIGSFWDFVNGIVTGNMTLTAAWEAISSSSAEEQSSSSVITPSSSSEEPSSSSSEDGKTPNRLPQIASTQISVHTASNAIILQNLPGNAKVEVYNLRGEQVYIGNSDNSKILRIMVQTKGIYIASISFGSERQVVRVPVR
jgi:uncharacterized repeat protein (TIGR02543 family)